MRRDIGQFGCRAHCHTSIEWDVYNFLGLFSNWVEPFMRVLFVLYKR